MERLANLLSVYDDSSNGVRFGITMGVWVAMLAAVVNIRSISNDNVPNVLIPVSLVREANLELSEFGGVIEGYEHTEAYWAVKTKSGIYSRYPVWVGVFASPVFAPFAMSGVGAGDEAVWLRTGRLAALLFTGLFAGVLACLFRRFMPGRWAVFLTMATILGTTVLHLLGSNLSNQTLPLVCLVILLSILSGRSMSWPSALAVGAVAGLAVSARLPAVFAAVAPLGLFVSRPAWRKFAPVVAAGALIFPVLTALYNYTAFGGMASTGYGAEAGERFEAPMWEGLAGLLLSPTCGLLVYSPFLILGCIGGFRCVRGRRASNESHDLGRWIVLGAVGQWFLFSQWWAWNGALTFGGARMLAETVPGIVVLLAINWPWIQQRAWAKRLLLMGGAFSIFLFLAGTVTYDAVAPLNPDKPSWNLGQDFIAIYCREYGPGSLAQGLLIRGAILLATIAVGGYLASRFLEDGRAEQPSTRHIGAS